MIIIDTLNLAERLRNLQKDEHSKLTIGAFFEFMRTAYQVNDSYEGLATVLSANSEIDWHELARINLDLEKCEDNKINNNNNSLNVQEEGNKDVNSIQDIFRLQTISSKETCTSENTINFQFSVTSCSTQIDKTSNKNDYTQERNNVESSSNKCSETIKEVNQFLESQAHNEKEKQSKEHLEESEYGLAKIMKENLRDVLHEGLLDSVLPYMLPKSALSQPIIKKSVAPIIDVKKSSSLNNIIDNKVAVIHKERDKEKNKASKKSLE